MHSTSGGRFTSGERCNDLHNGEYHLSEEKQTTKEDIAIHNFPPIGKEMKY